MPPTRRASAGLRGPGILLGIGFGGFVDGIVLHQILQWHHLLSATGDHPTTTIAGLEANTLADGLFHAATWVAALTGLLLAWRAARHGATGPTSHLVGWMLVGWGAFNLVEGIVDHHVLGLHHVREDVANQAAWDVGFLAFGVALVLVGLALARRGREEPVLDVRDRPSVQADVPTHA